MENQLTIFDMPELKTYVPKENEVYHHGMKIFVVTGAMMVRVEDQVEQHVFYKYQNGIYRGCSVDKFLKRINQGEFVKEVNL
ncbi:hypothetical protein SAMN05216389_1409 [Oceanobacillus limi]|uniref:Uncharacterized protein n=1 Tax=Oceanobacillus limi TaxID=930131 RepID=A0A1I0HM93_9BACI|nr:hypothetical protein [Oceanobacillus limi]SET85003.1 hypothetical protein SAMN05216389_1409 [Oceanobacillus limi]